MLLLMVQLNVEYIHWRKICTRWGVMKGQRVHYDVLDTVLQIHLYCSLITRVFFFQLNGTSKQNLSFGKIRIFG